MKHRSIPEYEVSQYINPTKIKALNWVAHRGYRWGDVRIPAERANVLWMLLGCPGSGKSLQIEAMINEDVKNIVQGSDERAVIHDPTGDLRAKLVTNAHVPVHSLNYYHRYAAKIDFANTVHGEEEARALAELIIPAERSNNPFFNNAARIVFQITLEYFARHCGRIWTLRDVVLLLRNVPLLRWLTQKYGDLNSRLLEGMGAAETEANIRSTVLVRTTYLDRIAACYEVLTDTISPDAFFRDSSILHLSYQARAGQAQKQLYEFLINRLVQVALDASEFHDRAMNHWYLDEFSGLANLFLLPDKDGEPLMVRFIRESRKKGNMLVLATQNPQQIIDVFEESGALAIMGLAQYFGFLNQTAHPAADFCSKVMGEAEVFESDYSTESQNGVEKITNWRRNTTLKRVPLYQAEEFVGLSRPDLQTGNGLQGIWKAESHKYRAGYTSRQISRMRMQVDPNVVIHDPIPQSDLRLLPWNDEDLYRLNIHAQVTAYHAANEDSVRDPQELETDDVNYDS